MSMPHINIGTFDLNPSAVLTTACSLAASAGSPLGMTSFSRLSDQAQDLIVRGAMGEFNDSPPPEISESVQTEIAQWASEPDAENVASKTRGPLVTNAENVQSPRCL